MRTESWVNGAPVAQEKQVYLGCYRPAKDRFFAGSPRVEMKLETASDWFWTLWGLLTRCRNWFYLVTCIFGCFGNIKRDTESAVFIDCKYKINENCSDHQGGTNMLQENNKRQILKAPTEFHGYGSGILINTSMGIDIDTARHITGKGIEIYGPDTPFHLGILFIINKR